MRPRGTARGGPGTLGVWTAPITPPPDYAFEPLREEDLPLVERWLLEPHVRRWWQEDEADYPAGTLEELRSAIRGDDPAREFLIRIDGRPAGQIQCYRTDDDPAYAAALALDRPAVGLDLFIGEPALIGLGHGPALLRQFVRDIIFVLYDVDICVIGPSTDNLPAIRAYEKAGFRHLRDVHVPGERTAEHLMQIARKGTRAA